MVMANTRVSYYYQLDECLEWIRKNSYRRVILQFKPENLEDSTPVVSYLKETYATQNKQLEATAIQSLDLYVTQSNTCCVDLIVTQHVSDVDAIIHFGKVCLSKPHIVNQETDKPVLFALTRVRHEPELFQSNLEKINDHIESLVKVNSDCPICIVYDTNLIDYAQAICDILRDKVHDKSIEVSQLILPSPVWYTTAGESLVTDKISYSLGQYNLSRPVDEYKSAIFLGAKPAIDLTLQLPSNLWKIDCLQEVNFEKVNVSRVLNKRMALVNRIRDDEELKFGVIITNPLPDISELVEKLGNYARSRKHVLYFITMIQTIDECKIGNFDLCDAFVVVNSCTCSTILESLYFNRPIISVIEFKLACGYEGVYGRVLWPSSDRHLLEVDLINKRKVSDVSLALIHSRNELLERCSNARANMWSGLDYKSTSDTNDCTIQEGLHGIASTYISEPLKKSTGDQ
jgi:diphthamide biosynthesis enzyme Dph1/Dph2-like protein